MRLRIRIQPKKMNADLDLNPGPDPDPQHCLFFKKLKFGVNFQKVESARLSSSFYILDFGF
jgi:hypothetical protein